MAAIQCPDGPEMEEAVAASAALSINTAGEVTTGHAKPTRGVVLKFATKSRNGGAPN